MSWQDELQQLDSALASGQISADEYRMRRDRVIAQASGQQVGGSEQQGSTEATTVFRPVQPQQGPPGDQAGDRTQIVQGGQGGQGHGQADADSTQVVPNTAQPPHFPPPQPPPPWESAPPQQPNMSPPPWANEDLPPEFGSQSWPRQGPEVFEEQGSGKAGKIIAIIVAVVLVLGGAGAAIWFFALKDKGDDKQTQQTDDKPTDKPTSRKPPPPDIPQGPFIELPGGAEKINKTMTMQQALAEKRPTLKEAQLLQSVGVAEVSGLVTEEDDGLRRGIWAFKAGDGVDPKAVLTAMDQYYDQAKYQLVSQDNGVLVRKLAASKPDDLTVFRAHFVTEDGYMVRVEVYGKDSANVESTFNDLLPEVTDKYPAVQ